MPNGLQQIADEYTAARGNLVESIQHLHQCGVLLNAEKQKQGHGRWLLWLERNEKALGFGARAARMMMEFGKRKLTTDLNDQKALTLSRELWGNGSNGKKPHRIPSRRAELIAKGISKTAADRVRYVEKNGIPELVDAIQSGALTPWQAKDIAYLTKAEQVVALKANIIADGPADTPEIFWRRGIMNRAAESIGHALFDDSWKRFSVDQKLIDTCMAVAEAWEMTAAHLQNLFNEQKEVKRK